MPIKNSPIDVMGWFRVKAPDFVAECGERQVSAFADCLLGLHDVYMAARIVERAAKVRPDQELIEILLTHYNAHVMRRLRIRGTL